MGQTKAVYRLASIFTPIIKATDTICKEDFCKTQEIMGAGQTVQKKRRRPAPQSRRHRFFLSFDASSLPPEGGGVDRHNLLTSGGNLVGSHTGVVQGQFGQGGEVLGLHLVQLGQSRGYPNLTAEGANRGDALLGGGLWAHLGRARQTHGSGNGAEPPEADRRPAVEGEHIRQQHRVADPVGQVVMSPQGVGHGVHHT